MANWGPFKRKANDVPAAGKVNFGDFRRLSPFSPHFGFDRGGPVDRYYVEKFLNKNGRDIKGKVLEIKSNGYTKKFGSQVTTSDVLDNDANNSNATVIADLTKADQIPANMYDCVILTQVLQYIYDCRAAIQTIHRILKPGGVLLMTVPSISQVADQKEGAVWYWTFHEAAIKKILGEFFPENSIGVDAKGNVLVAAAFLYGMGGDELTPEEYEFRDPDYQFMLTARAVKK
jgi:SAM-dependent methyltransferase